MTNWRVSASISLGFKPFTCSLSLLDYQNICGMYKQAVACSSIHLIHTVSEIKNRLRTRVSVMSKTLRSSRLMAQSGYCVGRAVLVLAELQQYAARFRGHFAVDVHFLQFITVTCVHTYKHTHTRTEHTLHSYSPDWVLPLGWGGESKERKQKEGGGGKGRKRVIV